MTTINSRKLLISFASVAVLATATACSSGSRGGLSFGPSGDSSGTPSADSGAGSDSGSGAGGAADNGAGGSGSGSANSGAGGGSSTSADSGVGGTDVADNTGGAGGSGAGGSGSGTSGGNGSGSGNDSDGGSGGEGSASPATGALQRVVDTTDPIVTTGNALLPGASGATGGAQASLDNAATQGDTAVNPVASVVVADQPLAGSSNPSATQALGVNALSNTPAQGQVLTANVGDNGQLLNVNANAQPVLDAATGAAGAAQGATTDALNGQNLAGAAVGSTIVGGASPVIGLGALSPNQPVGTVATAGVGAAGQTATANLAINNTTGAAASTLNNATNGGLNAVVSNGANNLVGAGVASTNPPQGSLASAGIASSDPLTLNVNGSQLSGGNQLINGQVSNSTLGGAPGLLGVSAASPTQPTGTVATAGVASGGQTATASTGSGRLSLTQ